MAKASSKEPPIAFTSDRLRLLAPFITECAVEMATSRMFADDFRIARRTKAGGKERVVFAEGSPSELKVALLLVLEMNPREHLNTEEEAILRGVDRKTVGVMRARGDVSDD